MTQDEKPSDDVQSEHGMQLPALSDGLEPTPSVLQLMYSQARALEAMAETVDRLVAQNQDLMAELQGREEGDQDEIGHGRDLAGNKIKVS